MKFENIILPVIILAVIGLIYFSYFAPTESLGSFNNFSIGSEINQEINVAIIKGRGIERTGEGKIISFLAKDINNIIVRVVLHNPVGDEILNSEVVELLGHMHENSFTANRVTIIR